MRGPLLLSLAIFLAASVHAAPARDDDAARARRFGVVLGQPYAQVRKQLEATGWTVEPAQGRAPIEQHPEITCGEGRDAVCTVGFANDGEHWLLEVDEGTPGLDAINFFSDTVAPAPSVDTRCFAPVGKPDAPLLRMVTYRDSATDWIGGYARYGTSRRVLPVVLEDEVEVERAGDRPSVMRMVWREFVDGKPAGRYETMSQGGYVEGLRYVDASGKRSVDFDVAPCP
jgi:hypothetical protein